MSRIHLTSEGWACVIVALGVIVAAYLIRGLLRQERARRELHRRAHEGAQVRQGIADFTEDCQIAALAHRRRIH